MSDWNRFTEWLIESDLHLEEYRLALVFGRLLLGFRRYEERFGDDFLRELSHLHGRSLERARSGLIEKGLLHYEPGSRGRGKRSLYRLLIDFDNPASGREFWDKHSSQKPADKPAEKPAAQRGRITEEGKKEGRANALPGKRRQNSVFRALAEACQIRAELLNPTSPIYDKDLARQIGVAQADIRTKAVGLDDEVLAQEVQLRADAYRRRWPHIDLTPPALAKHWNRVSEHRPGRLITAAEIAALPDTNNSCGGGLFSRGSS